MNKFKYGDKVRLVTDKDNNNPMAVNGYQKDTSQFKESMLMGCLTEYDQKLVICVWRDKYDIPHEEKYHEDTLITIS